jgi:hypothetical protein
MSEEEAMAQTWWTWTDKDGEVRPCPQWVDELGNVWVQTPTETISPWNINMPREKPTDPASAA